MADRPGGVSALETAERAERDRASPRAVMPGAGTGTDGDADGDDARRRQARKDAGSRPILHESVPVRYWDHDLGPAELRLFAVGGPAGGPGRPGGSRGPVDGPGGGRAAGPHAGPGARPGPAVPSASRRTAARSRRAGGGGRATASPTPSWPSSTWPARPGGRCCRPPASTTSIRRSHPTAGTWPASARRTTHPRRPGDVTIALCAGLGGRPPGTPRCASRPGGGPRRHNRRSPGLKARTRWPVTIASP